MAELTYGQKAVGLGFNPSGDDAVNMVKTDAAKMIDDMNDLRVGSQGEKARMASLAITHLQEAQMWAVKALTWKDEQ